MISKILKATDNALDQDEAKVAAHVLNTDMLAMQRLGGRQAYTADDVQRLNRIMGEYADVSNDVHRDLSKGLGSALATGLREKV